MWATRPSVKKAAPRSATAASPATKAVLSKVNEYHGFLPLPDGEFRPSVGSVVPVVPNHVCPVVLGFEELIVTDSTGTSLERWPVDARGFLN